MQPTNLSAKFNAEVRANLARQRRTVPQLAAQIPVSIATIYRWMGPEGEWPLNAADTASQWLGWESTAAMIRAGQVTS